MEMAFNEFSNSLKNYFDTTKENEKNVEFPFEEFIEPIN